MNEILSSHDSDDSNHDPRLAEALQAYMKARDGAPDLSVQAFLVSHPEWTDLADALQGIKETEDKLRPLAEGGQIGPYKLLQKIGEGGMGEVYMAEQAEPIRRRVAVKIITQGTDTRQAIARFEAERQALALMDHPNIAKVLDAGTTQSGRPYFVMELIKGVPITDFCDKKKFTLRQRLDLFIPVCEAVQHAHHKGLIHRDLKPTNILVAEYDDRIVPKIIDFGVAKAVGQQLTEKTLFTRFGDLPGTLGYMSPEQAKFNALDIDTRSDIYSLGVVLYELVTGTRPLTKERMKDVALDVILHLIQEEEADKPSDRLSSLATLPTIAIERNVEPVALTQQVRDEVDAIVMKALEKDRSRRYETPAGLARDIQRYLQGQPVEARLPTLGYRMRKFIKRYKAQVLAASLLVLSLIGGIIGTTIGMVDAKKGWGRAEIEAELARKKTLEAEKAQKVAEDQATLRKEAKRRAAGLVLDRSEQAQDVAEAALVKAQALALAPEDDHDLQRSIRLDLACLLGRSGHVTDVQDLPRELPRFEPYSVVAPESGELVWVVAVSHDGERLVTFRWVNTVEFQLRKAKSLALIKSMKHDNVAVFASTRIRDHFTPSAVNALFSPDGQFLVTSWGGTEKPDHWKGRFTRGFAGSGENREDRREYETRLAGTHIWDAKNGDSIGNPLSHHVSERCVAFNGDSNVLLVDSSDQHGGNHKWRALDCKSWKPIGTAIDQATKQTRLLDRAFQGMTFATLTRGSSSKFQCWDLSSGKKLAESDHAYDFIVRDSSGGFERASVPIVGPNGRVVVTLDRDRCACFWEVKTGALLARLDSIKSNKQSSDVDVRIHQGQFLLLSLDKGNQFWDLNRGAMALDIPAKYNLDHSRLTGLDSATDGFLVSTLDNQEWVAWSLETGQVVHRMDSPSFLSPKCTSVISHDGKSTLLLLPRNATKADHWNSRTFHSGIDRFNSALSDGRHVLVGTTFGTIESCRVKDLKVKVLIMSGGEAFITPSLKMNVGKVKADGGVLEFTSNNGLHWRKCSLKPTIRPRFLPECIAYEESLFVFPLVAVGPDGQVAIGSNKSIATVNGATGDFVRKPLAVSEGYDHICFGRNLQSIAALRRYPKMGDPVQTFLDIWDVTKVEKTATFMNPGCALPRDNWYEPFSTAADVFMVEEKDHAQVYRLVNGEKIGKRLSLNGRLVGWSQSNDGSRLVTKVTRDNKDYYRSWKTETGEPLGAEIMDTMFRSAVSSDGSFLALMREDNRIYVQDISSGQVTHRTAQYFGNVIIKFSPDNRVLCCMVDNRIDWWYLGSEGAIQKRSYIPHMGKGPFQITFASKGSRCLVHSTTSAQLFDFAQGEEIGKPIQRNQGRFCRDNTVVVCWDKAMRVEDQATKSGQGVVLYDAASGRRIGPARFALGSLLGVGADGHFVTVSGHQARNGVGAENFYFPAVWTIPQPIEGSVEKIALWTEVLFGARLDQFGEVQLLDAAGWRERKDRLDKLGGPPVIVCR